MMAACEKCWSDSYGDADRYRQLLKDRIKNPCTPEQQAGPEGTLCRFCKTNTIHQWAKQCMRCGFTEEEPIDTDYLKQVQEEERN